MRNKNGTMQIAVLITVILTFVLIITALFIFSSRQIEISAKLMPNMAIDKVYSRAEILNFQLNQICREIQSEENPVEDFKKILLKYKNKNGVYAPVELKQIEDQADVNHIKIDENAKLTINFDIIVSNESVQKKSTDDGLKSIGYSYQFKFEEIMS